MSNDIAALALSSFISAAGSCAHEMLSNASYVSNELLSLRLPSSNAESVAAVCSSLIGTKHDVVSELFELEGVADDAASEVVQRRVERIHRCLGEELPRLHSLVKSLETAAQDQFRIGTAYILVSESAVNILRSFGRVADEAEAYLRAARAEPAALGRENLLAMKPTREQYPDPEEFEEVYGYWMSHQGRILAMTGTLPDS